LQFSYIAGLRRAGKPFRLRGRIDCLTPPFFRDPADNQARIRPSPDIRIRREISMRLQGKTAIVIGAGQGPGTGMGNGRATVLRFAEEGAKVMAVDRDLASAEETVAMVKPAGNGCFAFEADVVRETTLAAAIAAAMARWGRIDILHYNVGVSIAGGDAQLLDITEEAFDRITAINLRGAVMACKHVVPIMREQRCGSILMISSLAAVEKYPFVTYKATKAAMIAFTQQVAIQNAEYGIRANVILPGLMDTPMAVDTRVRASGKSREQVAAERDARVPLRHKMGTAWDVANAALFLASDEAAFITGVSLLVDGGGALNVG
jgi:NAD(P)-dependent dehydrogenase (short-subunit alcohol dehydrogenase family)